MSDKFKGFVVTFEDEVSGEYMDRIQDALYLLKGVISVEGSVKSIDDHMNQEQVRQKMRNDMWEVIRRK